MSSYGCSRGSFIIQRVKLLRSFLNRSATENGVSFVFVLGNYEPLALHQSGNHHCVRLLGNCIVSERIDVDPFGRDQLLPNIHIIFSAFFRDLRRWQ
ncbi:MAG: hypothetical protein ACE14M_10185 [Terriglobales bacterium]